MLPTASQAAATRSSPWPSSAHASGVVQLGQVVEAPALGRGTRAVRILGPTTYWITDDRSTPEHSVIVAWEPSAPPTVIFKASRAGGRFQALDVSSDWVAWIEHVGSRTWSDARVYAARRGGGEPILVDDMSRYGPLVTYPELALDGSGLFWTVPEVVGDRWRGRLVRRDLVGGRVETIEEGDDAIISWPAAANGVIAYEVARRQGDPGYAVRYRRDGQTFEIPGPVSEPAISRDHLLVKRGERYAEGGSIAAVRFGVQTLIDLGRGEAPHADGEFAVWSNGGALGAQVARPTQACVAPFLSTRLMNDSSESEPTIGDSRVAWVFLSAQAGSVTESVRTTVIQRLTCEH